MTVSLTVQYQSYMYVCSCARGSVLCAEVRTEVLSSTFAIILEMVLESPLLVPT